MKFKFVVISFSLWIGLAGPVWAALPPDEVKALPPAATHEVDFKSEIKPIIEASCIRCHGRGREKGGLALDTRETLLKGGDSGPAVVVGHGDQSYMVALVAGVDPDSIMPKKGKKLTPQECGILRAWIDQGAKWDPSITFGAVAALNLDPHLPSIPAGHHEENPVDRFMDAYFAKHNLKPGKPVSDAVFARRASLDTIGLLPTPEELHDFEWNFMSHKRGRLVTDLLSRNDAYAENWMSFWNDLLRNDYKGTGYIDGGRKQITKWLYNALRTNMPYDKFVAQLISPTDESAGFAQGIVWRGVVNASQKPPMQAAQNISQVFMGINLKCASCHDSFINDWQLSDSYGLANIYSDKPLEIYECDKPTGKKAPTKFLFPQLGEVSLSNERAVRLKELAKVVTCPKDGRLSRTIVNRLWARFMGRGLVEPVDDMQQVAWNQDLLDWLAEDLVAHHYDLKVTIARILTSKAYQLPPVDAGEQQGGDYVFKGPEVRRVTAEEFRDAVTSLTGVGYTSADADLGIPETVHPQMGLKKTGKWIWNNPKAAERAAAGHIYLREIVNAPALPTEAELVATADNSFELFINGEKVTEGNDFGKPVYVDIKKFLKKGDNIIAVHAVNNLPDNTAPTLGQLSPGADNPAGFFLAARVRGGKSVMDFASDKSWVTSDRFVPGWEKPGFDSANWKVASELGQVSMVPWRLSGNLINGPLNARYADLHVAKVRAVLVAADPLQTALGRPNRDQVVTTRSMTATTLQALELTNGKTLSQILKRGARELIAQNADTTKLIDRIYLQGVGRKPTAAEMKLARGLIGAKPQAGDVEDLLWTMVMLPEFQLIY